MRTTAGAPAADTTAGAAGQRRTPSLSGVARRTHRAAHAAVAFVASAAAAPCIRLRCQPPRDLPLARSSAQEKMNDLLLLLLRLLLLLLLLLRLQLLPLRHHGQG